MFVIIIANMANLLPSNIIDLVGEYAGLATLPGLLRVESTARYSSLDYERLVAYRRTSPDGFFARHLPIGIQGEAAQVAAVTQVMRTAAEQLCIGQGEETYIEPATPVMRLSPEQVERSLAQLEKDRDLIEAAKKLRIFRTVPGFFTGSTTPLHQMAQKILYHAQRQGVGGEVFLELIETRQYEVAKNLILRNELSLNISHVTEGLVRAIQQGADAWVQEVRGSLKTCPMHLTREVRVLVADQRWDVLERLIQSGLISDFSAIFLFLRAHKIPPNILQMVITQDIQFDSLFKEIRRDVSVLTQYERECKKECVRDILKHNFSMDTKKLALQCVRCIEEECCRGISLFVDAIAESQRGDISLGEFLGEVLLLLKDSRLSDPTLSPWLREILQHQPLIPDDFLRQASIEPSFNANFAPLFRQHLQRQCSIM
jgi:hypothetical protein